ncbi:hypothetical protein PV11_01846 [Exophiala sideris]|uniref:Uncharacterized protein n=1 Tax=Exophiala sideris TaxID=1016849 RepID=A0A0D1YXD8_9EURO|nr:hypothetical protein PV11_01846 [Exophiala sideris]
MSFYKTRESGVETVPQPHQPVAEQNASTTDSLVFDDELFMNFDGVQQHLARLNALSDQLRAAHTKVDRTINRIRASLEAMWKQNAIYRRRGLKGGRARAQQAKKGRLAVCLQDLTPEQNKRRREVERQDFKGRNQIEGLKQILTIFEDCHQFITGQRSITEEFVNAGRMVARGTATPMEAWIVSMADEILPDAAKIEEIDEIEAMLDAFHDEYGL